MLKPTVKRGLMLDFIPDEVVYPAKVNTSSVYKLNNKEINKGDIVYFMSRELRVEDNWGLIFATELAKEYKRKLKVIIVLDSNYYSKHQLTFLVNGLKFLRKNLEKNNINFAITEKTPKKNELKAGAIIVDFNPINLQDDLAKNADCSVFEVDSHNITPTRFISNKQEFSAATLRRKIYANIAGFLTEYPKTYEYEKTPAHFELESFIQNKLEEYSTKKNDPNEDMTSKLSPYLHFGFISSQRIALEILKASASRENKEAFLEELIVRKELSDNFCLFNKNYKNLNGILTWAIETLESHKSDIRTYKYCLQEFEYAQTHDSLWNKIQLNLLEKGRIHGYLRMYWAKKIMEWSNSPEEALETAIYLNDTYALDGIDPNGYVGILWSIGGIHDRPFSNRLVTGKIRYMSIGGCKKKFDVIKYTG